jgi:hypothetical protein
MGDANRGGVVNTSALEIAELNVRHYRDLLKAETDPKKRRTIAALLAEEEAKLAMLKARERRDVDKGGTEPS